MKLSHKGNRIDTTLGDLITAISDVAFEYAADKKEAYYLAYLVLADILHGAPSEEKSLTGALPSLNT